MSALSSAAKTKNNPPMPLLRTLCILCSWLFCVHVVFIFSSVEGQRVRCRDCTQEQSGGPEVAGLPGPQGTPGRDGDKGERGMMSCVCILAHPILGHNFPPRLFVQATEALEGTPARRATPARQASPAGAATTGCGAHPACKASPGARVHQAHPAVQGLPARRVLAAATRSLFTRRQSKCRCALGARRHCGRATPSSAPIAAGRPSTRIWVELAPADLSSTPCLFSTATSTGCAAMPQ